MRVNSDAVEIVDMQLFDARAVDGVRSPALTQSQKYRRLKGERTCHAAPGRQIGAATAVQHS